jgi:hypothetical protein
MPSNYVTINTATKLYQTFRKLQDTQVAIEQLKVRMDSVLGSPADYNVLGADYGISSSAANTLYLTIQSMNTTLGALPFTSIKDYDQEK